MLHTTFRLKLFKVSQIISITACFLFFIFPAHANDVTQVKQQINPFVKNMESESKAIQGGAVAIILDNKVIYKKAFGYTKANGSLINDDTTFSLASVSKPIVATGIGALVDKRLLSFDEKLKLNYLKNSLCLRDFLSHTKGYNVRGDIEIENGCSRQKLLNYLQKQKPNFQSVPPYSYSNLMYSLVAEILKTKGYELQDIVDLINSNSGSNGIVLLPLTSAKNFARPHSRDKKELTFPSNYQKNVPAAAGLIASLNGMIEFLQISLGNRPNIISQTTLDKIYKPVVKASDIFGWKVGIPFDQKRIQSWYCLGWRALYLDNNYDSRLIFHSGYINGATTFVGFVPSRKLAIVILTNQSSKFAVSNGLKFWHAVIVNAKN